MTPELREERRDSDRADTITFDEPPQARLRNQNFDTLQNACWIKMSFCYFAPPGLVLPVVPQFTM